MVDPKNPGAVDEIIHLGDFWDEAAMRKNKDVVMKLNSTVGRLFRIAYNNLKEALVIKEELESYYTECTNFARVNEVTAQAAGEIFAGVTGNYTVEPRARHLFATAISPDGAVHYFETLLQDVEKVYLVKGEAGTGQSTLVARIADTAHRLGLATEVYHCALEPDKVDIVIIPALKVAVMKQVLPIIFDPANLTQIKEIRIINLSEFIDQVALSAYAKEITSAKERFWQAFYRAVGHIHEAKQTHDEMEKYYIPNMNFAAVNAKREEVLQRILKYADEYERGMEV